MTGRYNYVGIVLPLYVPLHTQTMVIILSGVEFPNTVLPLGMYLRLLGYDSIKRFTGLIG